MSIALSRSGPWVPIVEDVPNNGRYQWVVGSDLPTSSNYDLRFTLDSASVITPQPFTIQGAWLPGDSDGDGAIDLDDFGEFPACVTGPSGGPPLPDCFTFDFDGDEDVDLFDFAAFQASFTGATP